MDAATLSDTIDALRHIGAEQQRIEVKSGVGKSIRDTLSAFSNSDGGVILVGLDEEHGFTPRPGFDAAKARDAIEQRCAQLTPAVRPLVEIHSFEEQQVLVVEVPPMASHDKPCYVTEKGRYNGSFIRVGDGDVQLTAYEIDRLLEEKTQPRWDDQPVEDATLDDLDDQLLRDFLEIHRERRPKTFSEGADTALKRLKILADGRPTLAALLALGEYPQQFFPRLSVTFALFPGTTKGDIVSGERLLDSATLSGTVQELVEQGVAIAKKNMRTGALIGESFRTDLPDYPPVAIREALTNALMHRDYSPMAQGSPVQMNMFVDRLEITSPGGLYGGVTVRNLGEPGNTSSRNHRLSTFLEDVPLPGGGVVAENRGTGIAVMLKASADALMPPPSFRNTIDSFTVTFYRRRVATSERHVTARDHVLNLLRTAASVSTTEVVGATGLSRTAVQKALNELIADGVVERTEPSRSPRQRYRLTT
ncbi:ATP-binding protein [Corynebacterium uterequi]|uniref:ATP-binding protein n=1 Tax=Corynebacterium uterequi TaxID=1072256 RepID=UPI000640EA8A|nr:ATP-binding protein [Corynebacterium uterequi]